MFRASKAMDAHTDPASPTRISEATLRDALLRVTSAINVGDSSVQYDFIIQRLDVSGLTRNWAVAATATTPWKADQWNACQHALDEVREAIPIIDWSCSASLLRQDRLNKPSIVCSRTASIPDFTGE